MTNTTNPKPASSEAKTGYPIYDAIVNAKSEEPATSEESKCVQNIHATMGAKFRTTETAQLLREEGDAVVFLRAHVQREVEKANQTYFCQLCKKEIGKSEYGAACCPCIKKENEATLQFIEKEKQQAVEKAMGELFEKLNHLRPDEEEYERRHLLQSGLGLACREIQARYPNIGLPQQTTRWPGAKGEKK